jgi:hypothetical protein
MTLGTVGEYLSAAVMALMGCVFTLYAYRVAGPEPGVRPEADTFHRRWGRLLRVVSPLMVAYGLVRLVFLIVRDA